MMDPLDRPELARHQVNIHAHGERGEEHHRVCRRRRELRARKRTSGAIKELMGLAPKQARVVRDGKDRMA